MSVDNIPLPPPAMFSSSSSSSDHQSNKYLNFGCAECEGQAEHERIKSLLKQKKGKGSGGGGGKHPKVTENPDPENPTTGSSDQEVVWTKSSYSTLPNPRSRGREKHQGHPHHPHQDQPGSQVWDLHLQGGQDRNQDQGRESRIAFKDVKKERCRIGVMRGCFYTWAVPLISLWIVINVSLEYTTYLSTHAYLFPRWAYVYICICICVGIYLQVYIPTLCIGHIFQL